MLTPDQIRRRALNGYEDFLRSLSREESFFPLKILGAGWSRPTDFGEDRAAIEALQNQSKERLGFGYSITWEDRTYRRWGGAENSVGGRLHHSGRLGPLS